MRKTIFLMMPILFILAACGTVSSNTAETTATNDDATIASRALNGATQCPSVGIVEDLRSMTLFANNDKPDPNAVLGYAKLEDFDGDCTYENGVVTLDLDVVFAGRLNGKNMPGRATEPSIAFPYFIAISDDQGNVLNKEVFAVALRFREGLETTRQAERLKPRIPLSDPALGGRYQVLIGFQLNRQQLEFNRGG